VNRPGSGPKSLVHLRTAELATLARLRERFLTGRKAGGGYWRDEGDLALYDVTFAERIGWKWDAVIEELGLRSWKPRARHVVDFGCGSGVAHRRVLGAWSSFASLAVLDVSPLAVTYATRRAREMFPMVEVRAVETGTLPPDTLLLVSHVINELDSAGRARLLALVRQAAEVIWVEAGTHADSRALIDVREELRGEFGIVAPCPHAARCGLLAAENAPHWCHHFGRVPSWVFQDGGWAQFGRELGIDITTLPYSYLVLQRERVAHQSGTTRMIGRPREFKGRMEVLCCREEGVGEFTLQKRDAPGLYKTLRKDRADTLQEWRYEAGKILPVKAESTDLMEGSEEREVEGR
jgi:SAM-dependent methyltransferase